MIDQTTACRLVESSIRAVVGIAIGVGCSAPAHGWECVTEVPRYGAPLPGIAAFSARVTVTASGMSSCATGFPACDGTFEAQSSADHGVIDIKCCPVPRPDGHTLWCFNYNPVRWSETVQGGGFVAHRGYDSSSNGFSTIHTSFSADIAFLRPAYMLSSASTTVTGGRVVNGMRVFHAGETVTLASDGTLFNTEGVFQYGLCLDVQPENGICDEYDIAARAFDDFDSSGSIDGVDLATLLAAWGSTGGLCDINRDGVVDANDLTFLLSRWGQGAP